MDASMVMSKPAPQPMTPSNTTASEAADDSEAFAAHLPPEETPPPPPRRTDTRDATSVPEETSSGETGGAAETVADQGLALSVAAAPVVVRPQNSTVTIDLSAVIAAATTPAEAATASPTLQSPKTIPGAAKPSSDPAVGNGAASTTTPQAAVTDPAAASEAQPQSAQASATPPKATAALESIALPVAPPGGDLRAPPRLRAGRSEIAETQMAEPRTTANISAPPASAARTASAAPQTATAIQAIAAPTADNTAKIDTPALPDAMPAEQRAHSLNEATATPAGHRATTPALLVAQHIIRRFDGQSTTIDVRLDPPELGRVQVSLEVGADNKVTAVVAAENPATLSDLVRSARELERALQDAGLELDAGGLTFDLAQQGDNASRDASASKPSSRGSAANGDDAVQAPVSRPFGLESWRGARVDVMA